MIDQWITSFIAATCFSILFNIPKKELVCCGTTGSIGWLVYMYAMRVVSSSTATFFAVIIVTFIARILANIRKTPFTLFAIAGIIPFVPGASIYSTMYLLVTGESVLAGLKGIETLKIACIISIAMILVLALPMHQKKPIR